MTERGVKVAVLLTCFNRAETTRRGVASLMKSDRRGVSLRLFAVDDMSTDHTRAVLESFGDQVEVIRGTGNLYWAGGMRLAEDYAARWSPDYYLWFNDDV